MAGCYLALRRWHSPWEVLGVLLITKSCDIGAYFAGRYLGRRKLVPWLSPGKTWEGLVGGVLLAVVAAVGFAAMSQHTNIATVYRTAPAPAESELYRVDGPNVEATPAEPAAAQRVSVHRYPIGWAVIAGVVFALVGQLGDLTMSLFKRDAGVKDSGATIPGFGGVLDVVDSPLLVAPVAYWLLSAAVISVPA